MFIKQIWLCCNQAEYDPFAQAWDRSTFPWLMCMPFCLLFAKNGLLIIFQVLDPCSDSNCADDQADSVVVEYDDFVKV